MTRDELIARLKELIADCLAADENAAAAVLSTLIGALYAGQEPQLHDIARAFAIESLRGIRSRQN